MLSTFRTYLLIDIRLKLKPLVLIVKVIQFQFLDILYGRDLDFGNLPTPTSAKCLIIALGC